MPQAKVRFINGAGDGKAQDIEIEPGASLVQVLGAQNVSMDNGVIRVNAKAVDPSKGDITLNDGDRVTVAPTNVKGA